MSAADLLRKAIEALPEDQRGTPRWIVDPQTGTDGPLAAYIGLMDPTTGSALVNHLDRLMRCLRSYPHSCEHRISTVGDWYGWRTDECLAAIGETATALEQAIERSQG